MREAFSINREFDFVRMDGLRRATGRPAHEWDLYIVKELVDNALDADDALWCHDPTLTPKIKVRYESFLVPELKSPQLFVSVQNCAPFPVDQITDIFDPKKYTSRKAFLKTLTRGSLGNALKTILGIPYALFARVSDGTIPKADPLSIKCGATEYLPRYIVDGTNQTIHFGCPTKTIQPVEGTLIRVGLDYFEQEFPRTVEDLRRLADQYHLCNPHVRFQWEIEIEGENKVFEFEAKFNWTSKFRGLAPVHWYTVSAFQDLLSALYRIQKINNRLPIDIVCQNFAGLELAEESHQAVAKVVEKFGQPLLSETDIEGPASTRLYGMLCDIGSYANSISLGQIGVDHVREVLRRIFPIKGKIFYEVITEAGDDPYATFVIEVALLQLSEGKRQIWTAINFTPTYDDPFLRRWLRKPVKPDNPDIPVLGLRGFLDAYDLHEDSPVVLFLHLICPNVEHNEFSKTEINHLPFRQALGQVLDKLLTALRRVREDEELHLEQTVFRVLDGVFSELGEDERYVFDQLLEKLWIRLGVEEQLKEWLMKPEARGSLRSHIDKYQRRNPTIVKRMARPTDGMVSLPLHPYGHISIPVEQFSGELLKKHHVNKVLYLHVPNLEPVVVENNWLCQMDMALLHNPQNIDRLQEAIVYCVARCGKSVPLLSLHDADETGKSVTLRIRGWLEKEGQASEQIIDLGLCSEAELGDSDLHPVRLVGMMPGELARWLRERFRALGISAKALPPDADVRQAIRARFERLVVTHLWEGMSHKLKVTDLLGYLDRKLHITDKLVDQTLDSKLRWYLEQEKPEEFYELALDRIVYEFFEDFMRMQSANFYEIVKKHLMKVQSG